MKIKFKNHHRSTGYITILVVIFMLILMSASFRFLDQASLGVKMAGHAKDSYESFLMAESSLNMLVGQFSNDLKSLEKATATDKMLGIKIQQNKDKPDSFLMPYMFYQTTGKGIDQTQSTLLQKIANNDAKKISFKSDKNQRINAHLTAIALENLFVNHKIHPKIYTLSPENILKESKKTNWGHEKSTSKAAVWFELTENPENPNAVDITAQAIGHVDNMTTYLQKFVGTYKSKNTLGSISLLTEASNVDRRPQDR